MKMITILRRGETLHVPDVDALPAQAGDTKNRWRGQGIRAATPAEGQGGAAQEGKKRDA